MGGRSLECQMQGEGPGRDPTQGPLWLLVPAGIMG